MGHTAFPDFESVRKGFVGIVECHSFDMAKIQEMKLLQKTFSQLFAVYPLRGSFRHYHTSSLFNTMASLFKKALPEHLSIQVGLQCEERLDHIFLVPNEKIATQRLMQEVENSLKRRYANEKAFSLESDLFVLDYA